jgi:hypothetical protein
VVVTAVLLGLLPEALPGQSIKSFTGWQGGGTLRIDFGGLREVGRGVRPCQMTEEIAETEFSSGQADFSPPPRTPSEPSPEALRGRAFVEKGMQAFSGSRWAEAIELLRQAQALLPGDVAVGRTLAAALIGLQYEEQARAADERAAGRAAEDSARVGAAIERLSEALNALRLAASQTLVDKGQFQSAIALSESDDFIFDSSVVDLRHVRQGIVDFAPLKPPASRTGRVDFSPPPRRAETPARQRARRFLDNPAVEAVMFYEGMGQALGYTPSEADHQGRYAGPVMRAVADRLRIDLRNPTVEEREYVERKTREVWEAYDRNKARQGADTAAVARQSIQEFEALVEKLKSQGILKPGEDILAKEKRDPMFSALMKSEVRAIVLEDNVGRREIARNSFDKLLADVGSVLEPGRKR